MATKFERNKPVETVYEKVVGPYILEQWKHNKNSEHAEDSINKMSNMELLQAISEAIEERLK